jgi:hypothetical protein
MKTEKKRKYRRVPDRMVMAYFNDKIEFKSMGGVAAVDHKRLTDGERGEVGAEK